MKSFKGPGRQSSDDILFFTLLYGWEIESDEGIDVQYSREIDELTVSEQIEATDSGYMTTVPITGIRFQITHHCLLASCYGTTMHYYSRY